MKTQKWFMCGMAVAVLLFCFCSLDVNNVPEKEPEYSYSGYDQSIVDEILNITLRYSLAIPTSYDSTQSYPLILALHFGGVVSNYNCADFLNNMVLPGLAQLNAIVLAPNCLSGDGWLSPALETAVFNCISILQTRYNIDPDRILIMGYSMGGIGTWYYTARHRGLFSAGIAIASSLVPEAYINPPDIPMFVIHGENDLTFPLDEIQPFVEEMQSKGKPWELRIIENGPHINNAGYIYWMTQAVTWIQNIWGSPA